MALNHESNSKISGKVEHGRQIFTFFVEDMMFGLGVDNVLMLGQEVSEIQRIPVEERGFCGVTKFQGIVVPVLDFAHRLGVPSGFDSKTALLEVLAEREQDHIEWVNALENALKTDSVFSKTIDEDECEFGKWLKKFDTRDETLKDLLSSFKEPHSKLHHVAETVIHLRDNGKKEEALEVLNRERSTTFRQLRALFARTRDQVQSGMRQVLLFVTLDGKSPRYALLIDEINDVLNYTAADFQASKSGALGLIKKIEHVIEGIYTRANTPDCLYFDVNKLTDVEEHAKQAS